MTVPGTGTFLTIYCGREHRLADGVPVAHRCRVLPWAAVATEVSGDIEMMIAILAAEPLVLGGHDLVHLHQPGGARP